MCVPRMANILHIKEKSKGLAFRILKVTSLSEESGKVGNREVRTEVSSLVKNKMSFQEFGCK